MGKSWNGGHADDELAVAEGLASGERTRRREGEKVCPRKGLYQPSQVITSFKRLRQSDKIVKQRPRNEKTFAKRRDPPILLPTRLEPAQSSAEQVGRENGSSGDQKLTEMTRSSAGAQGDYPGISWASDSSQPHASVLGACRSTSWSTWETHERSRGL